MAHSRLKDLPTIHYIWIGPPSCDSKDSVTKILEHDVTGPMLMANQNSGNPIQFWCLKKYLTHYEKHFKDKTNVKVLCIEDYLDSILQERRHEHYALVSIITKCLQTLLSSERGSVRDFVTAKEIIALFLLAIEGGYTLDTNIKPLTKNKVELPDYKDFQAPWLIFNDELECWMMYAPKKDMVAAKILQTYLDGWTYTEDVFNKENYSKNYHDLMGNLIIDSIKKFIKKPCVWQGKWDNDSEIPHIVKMEDLKFTKNLL